MAKRKQPETSREALDAKSAESKYTDFDKILNALKQIGSGNYDDIAKVIQLKDANVVSRRLKEMREANLIINTGEKTLTSRGRSAFVHTLSNLTQPKTQAAVDKREKAEVEEKPTEGIKYTQQEIFDGT